MKLWEGRFTQPSAKSADDFNQSLSFDYKLYWHDILASIAHVKMLGETQIIPKDEAEAISDALVNILADIEKGNLPIEGTLREEYDYFGASAAISVSRDGSTWLAAAKAFGDVGGGNPTALTLALGGFGDVRLIPVDAADVGVRGFDLAWLRHLRFHVPDYARSGFAASGCRYCSALRTWDNPAWRARALQWLERNGHTCRRPRPGGGGSSGGAAYGH